MWEYNHTKELYHYGIRGMKWGVRRYQNKDGSYTLAGKKRRNTDYRSTKKAEKNRVKRTKYEKKLDQINESIFKDRLVARNVDRNDPGTYLGLQALSERVRSKRESGERIVNTMIKKGLLPENSSFDKYAAKYERKVMDDCKKYIGEKYKINNPTDDDVNYFLEAYLFGGI